MGGNDRIIVALLAITALFYTASGIVLYFLPERTFDSLPGYYGAFNLHFVKDAGLAFLSSGLMLVLALLMPALRLVFAFCASLFVELHALFHLQMVLSGMVPSQYYSYEVLQIFLPALVLLAAVLLLYKRYKSQR